MELYLHIPFCVRKCTYCSFVSFPASDIQKEACIDAIIRETALRLVEFTEPVRTVYIGGGTPSLLSPQQLSRLLHGITEIIPFHSVLEFTIEANPGTLTEPFLRTAKELGINRFSIGMQSAQDRLLKLLGRIHSFHEVEESVLAARKHEIDNISLDLIFGIPGQSMKDWEETLNAAIRLNPAHISAYGLIPEEGTPLYQRLENREMELPDPDLERDMYSTAIGMLLQNGFHQYEISNFAKKGFECRHNIGYWTQVPYVGLGVSAASMRITEHSGAGLRCIRRTNPQSFDSYLRMVNENDLSDVVTETVGPEESRFETMMLSLRMNSGIRSDRFLQLHGIPPEECYGKQLEKMRGCGLMKYENGAWSLTRKGMDIQNSILLEFMEDPS